jgi:hypothetical protein
MNVRVEKRENARPKRVLKRGFWLLMLILFSGLAQESPAEVLFSDTFDNIPNGWNCDQSTPPGWTDKAACFNGGSRYSGEITSGGVTGNSLKLWRRNGWTTEYCGYLNRALTSSEFSRGYKELFFRWYMKIPGGWNANLNSGQTHKLNRTRTATSYGGPITSELYFDVKGGTFKSGRFSFYNTKEGVVRYTSKTVTELGVVDGQWHCYEIHFKMNSASGVADGALHFYIDGVQVGIYTPYGSTHPQGLSNWNFGYASNECIATLLTPAIGNLTDGVWSFPTSDWYAIEFDNYVVSTSYTGPGGSAPPPPPAQDITPPGAPRGLRIVP